MADPPRSVRMQPEPGQESGQGWTRDGALGWLFEDLEQQAEGLRLTDRDAEVADRGRAEYAGVEFLGRVHASVGGRVRLVVHGLGLLEGSLLRAGTDWCLVAGEDRAEWVVRLDAVLRAAGLAGSAVGEPARPALTRLRFGSVLRGIAESRVPVLLAHRDASRTQGFLARVGADFVELAPGDDRPPPSGAPVELVPFAGLAAARPL